MEPEDLHALHPSSMPPHELRFKIGMMCLLMRNMRPKLGLVNGRRVRIVAIRFTIIEVEIVGGDHDGERAYIPRITFTDEKSYCFVLKRLQVPIVSCAKKSVCLQFPLQPAYAMTINKSQGQTLAKVGLYLPNHCFAHGQFYVAISRVTHPSCLKVPFVMGIGNRCFRPWVVTSRPAPPCSHGTSFMLRCCLRSSRRPSTPS